MDKKGGNQKHSNRIYKVQTLVGLVFCTENLPVRKAVECLNFFLAIMQQQSMQQWEHGELVANGGRLTLPLATIKMPGK